MASTDVDTMINKFNDLTDKPVKFLTIQTEVKDDIKNLVKSLYDFTKSQEKFDKKEKKSALPELIVQDFDEEQIWQQIELQNTECWDHLVWEVANCMSAKNDLLFPVETSNNENISENESDIEEQMPEDENSESDPENDDKIKKSINKKSTLPKSKVKPSIVDDQFFKLQEMERFLLNEEKKGGKAGSDSEESIDMFEDIDDDDSEDEEGGKGARYNDFFSQEDEENDVNGEYEEGNGEIDNEFDEEDNDVENEEIEEDEESEQEQESKKKDKKVRFADPDDSSDDNSDGSEDSNIQPKKKGTDEDQKKSEFEERQQRLKQTIDRLEAKSLAEAPWQLKGEVDATKRPQNSLLEEVVDFDLTSRPAPIITEQTTLTLEDIIRRRIKDKAWDDVERKEKPVDDQLKFRKTEVLDHAKSKQSLAQVYEAEYLKQKQALSGEVEEEKEPEAHKEIRDTMSKLFSKLDALCHYHYTPKAPQAEVKIVSNTPAISMEEVAPVATSDATLLAPEEVKRKRKGDLLSKEERTQTDKNRERRKKKKLQRKKGKVEKVTEHRNTQKGTVADDKSLKTSKAFFQQLNDDSRSVIKKNRNVKNKGQ